MKFVCGLNENVCDNTRLFWDFRYLKVSCNLSVKCKLNCRRLFGKLPRNDRHLIVKTSKRFFLMGLLQQNVKSSCSEVFCKNDVLKIFAKFTGKHLCWGYRKGALGYDGLKSSFYILLCWYTWQYSHQLRRISYRAYWTHIKLQTFMKSIMQFTVPGNAEVNASKGNISLSLLKTFYYRSEAQHKL